ncbi:hypothetical protein Cs7R123_15800 [Catellatospora sp. TT07R-123]|uniref:PD40 domain-containing protein n=1 Tax=Catellatospora sp. TT07R-123 TaxID=2733863 RepID=UPI001AFE1E03|nr:PD40 domain-containing protein [Catellatospora sp. TT07R-123]GHJ44238.1 hypothetical protein Cs7R123_15800 [Catellatospora sp. TT07R-123]
MGVIRRIAAGVCLAAAAVLVPVAPAQAVSPGVPGKVAFIRGGNLFIAETSGAVWQATTGGGYERPRWRPGPGDGLAVLKGGDLFLGRVDSASHLFTISSQLSATGGHAGAGAWSPDGSQLAYAEGSWYNYAPTIHIVSVGTTLARSGRAADRVVDTRFSAAAQRLADSLPKKPAAAANAVPVGTWNPLQYSLTVAWSPDGRWIAYPNGECWAIFDDCLSILEVATGTETWAAAFGGGGADQNGFATEPSFTADSSLVLWTQQTQYRYDPAAVPGPLQTISAPPTSIHPQTQIGADWEYAAVPSPAGDGSVLVTAGRSGVAWVTLRNGATRRYLYQGYQHDWQAR